MANNFYSLIILNNIQCAFFIDKFTLNFAFCTFYYNVSYALICNINIKERSVLLYCSYLINSKNRCLSKSNAKVQSTNAISLSFKTLIIIRSKYGYNDISISSNIMSTIINRKQVDLYVNNMTTWLSVQDLFFYSCYGEYNVYKLLTLITSCGRLKIILPALALL